MYKISILLLILLSACTQYTAITPIKPEYILTLNNNINGIDLYEDNNKIFINNISSQLIIEIDYSVNTDNIKIYDILVPNEKLFIYTWGEYDTIITINDVIFY